MYSHRVHPRFFDLITPRLPDELHMRCQNATRGLSQRLAPLFMIAFFSLSACSQTDAIVQPRDSNPLDEPVAVIAGSPFTLDDYAFQYRKSEGLSSVPVKDTIASYRDFLERYVNFRLKVLEAREAGYHELEDLNAEIETYRSQLARPYMLEQTVVEPLIREMYDRRRELVKASHILIRVAESAPPADTLAAFIRISAILDSLDAGQDFGDLAILTSEDPSASNPTSPLGYRGNLGFFGGGRMVKAFEDAAYGTAPGEVSPIFRSQFGYHILTVHEKRQMPDEVRVAHIMIQLKGQTAADSVAALARVDEVTISLAAGDDFADVARKLSDDQSSASSGGGLQTLSYDAGLPIDMRDTAFSLELDEVSEVVESPYGFHFIKLLERIPSKSFEESAADLRLRLRRLPRAQAAENDYAISLRKHYGGRADSVLIETWITTMTPDSLFRKIRSRSFGDSTLTRPIAWLADSVYTVKQFIDFVSSSPLLQSRDQRSRIWSYIDQFLNESALKYKVFGLESEDAGFKSTMDEFRDGLVLFRLMEDSVWTAASIDSTGLQAYYSERAETFRYSDRTRVISITSSSDSLLQVLADKVRSGSLLTDAIRTAREDSTISIRVDSTMIEGTTNSVFDRILEQDAGQISDPASYNRGYIVMYNNGTEIARQKTFEEARPQAINGYQEVLEARLIDRLRNKFNVQLYPERLRFFLSNPILPHR